MRGCFISWHIGFVFLVANAWQLGAYVTAATETTKIMAAMAARLLNLESDLVRFPSLVAIDA